MTRTVIATIVMAAGVLFAAFAVSAAAAYAVNELCTDKMAWIGNC